MTIRGSLIKLLTYGKHACCRNWHWDEPSCGNEMCVVLYHQPSTPPDEGGRLMFQWNDDNCNTKNNFVCKYSEGELYPGHVISRQTLWNIADRNVMNRVDMICYSTCQRVMFVSHHVFLSERSTTLCPAEHGPGVLDSVHI